ncbi:MAG: aminotransferase class I/II-fold pyridoxal phosphate-dependent enzyme [Candidatus Omnitrophica bacterium]|nr:aminotransferase class I/II-fold pyridoxal phosphate-dependent enzyme [Candidatus Omnitrophota bacterium]
MRFTIGFDLDDKKKVFECWDEIITTHKWSEGKYTEQFEEKWSRYHNLDSVSFVNWTGAALAVIEFFKLKGEVILCPSNTFMATPLCIINGGAKVEFVDCNRDDLCMDVVDLKKKIEKFKPKAVCVVHIGGHIAFQIKEIAKLCKEKNIVLIEDCAHTHGASWDGVRAGAYGDVGLYSFYATKTISTGEGGMLVTKNKALVEFARKFRNYGKFDYVVQGINARMSEFTAALGCVQIDRLDDIIRWKNEYAKKHLDPKYPKRMIFPKGMISGLYKYIVFDPIEKSTGKVYDQPCHHFIKRDYPLPNTDWVAQNHWCVPLYYKGEEL